MLLAPVVRRTARASTCSSWRNCAPRASSAPASTARWWNWTSRRRWTCASKHTHRGGGGPRQGARGPAAAPGGILRDRPALSDGLARMAFMDEPEREELVSPPSSPARVRLQPGGTGTAPVLLQQPGGACPECDGLGVRQFFDPARVVASPPEPGRWRGARLGPAQRLLLPDHQLAGGHYGSTSTPRSTNCRKRCATSSCTAAARRSSSSVHQRTRRQTIRRHAFEGIIPNLERRYRETESNAVREELAKYLSTHPAPTAAARA
jgi:excinuclease UvrABC ATPase subunit